MGPSIPPIAADLNADPLPRLNYAPDINQALIENPHEIANQWLQRKNDQYYGNAYTGRGPEVRVVRLQEVISHWRSPSTSDREKNAVTNAVHKWIEKQTPQVNRKANAPSKSKSKRGSITFGSKRTESIQRRMEPNKFSRDF